MMPLVFGLSVVLSMISIPTLRPSAAFLSAGSSRKKDYISHVKPNGYRSYHIIIEVTAPFEDIDGKNPGRFFAELQLRTIAMDSWASLEHQMKYKQDIKNPQLIIRELKRCADELASCDVSMQTIRNLIHAQE